MQTQTMALLAAVLCLKMMLAVDVEVGDGRCRRNMGVAFCPSQSACVELKSSNISIFFAVAKNQEKREKSAILGDHAVYRGNSAERIGLIEDTKYLTT